MHVRPALSSASVLCLTLSLTLAACTSTPDPTESPDPESPDPEVTATVTPGPEDDPSPSATPPTSPTPPAPTGPVASPDPVPLPDPEPPAEESPFPADRSVDTAEPSGRVALSPTDLRFGVHEGYDRVVLDLAGEGSPGWRAEYVDDPTQMAAGGPVYLPGEAYLLLLVEGVIYPTEPGAVEFEGPRSILPQSAGVVQEVRYGAMFEGQLEIWVGLSSEQPFRVFRLEDPTRVVLDMHHP
jgi:hypothetical protein